MIHNSSYISLPCVYMINILKFDDTDETSYQTVIDLYTSHVWNKWPFKTNIHIRSLSEYIQ